MKILWISYFGSWTRPLLKKISEQAEIFLIVPSNKKEESVESGIPIFYIPVSSSEYNRHMTKTLFEKYNDVISRINPDIIHVHGTEKNIAEIQQFLPEIPVIVSIQGLVGACRPYSKAYLDESIVKKYRTLKNYLGFGGTNEMEKICRKASVAEDYILRNIQFFFGRTNFDKAHILFRNPQAHYFIGQELLREEFVANKKTWSIDKCEKYSIFMPSGFNPIKGMHLAIETVRLLKSEYPEIMLYIPGVMNDQSRKKFLSPLWGEEYIRYCIDVINKNNLSDNIVFLPRLSAIEMVNYMQKVHVFLASSSIDNSPNAIAEASMIGTPIVSTPVGGIPSFLHDMDNSLLSPAGDPYLLALNVKKIFDDDNIAQRLSDNAYKMALTRHDPNVVADQYMFGYNKAIEIFKSNK